MYYIICISGNPESLSSPALKGVEPPQLTTELQAVVTYAAAVARPDEPITDQNLASLATLRYLDAPTTFGDLTFRPVQPGIILQVFHVQNTNVAVLRRLKVGLGSGFIVRSHSTVAI